MGVPKFYRWISQRYPCINQILENSEVVPIDHLYLDMNGIIHSSSHGDGIALNIYNEAKVFDTIAEYTKHIVSLIRPRKSVFLAVDGVAPRAKMTQQRARRFVGPKKQAEEVRKRKEKGISVDEKSLFDSNVISPGTEFMARLHEFFKTFIAEQVTANPFWRRIDVIYSGHDVPGEGEQKIREYMSYQRTLPLYCPTERHCLYGMDADLIFLGLATHEPNLCILRENVYTVKSPKPEDIPFVLVHLSLLREYIGLEFGDLKSELSFEFDLERIIDDWIFMGYLLGNDFIPHLPNMHIHAESMLYLWDTYHVVLPRLDGYINEFGTLNLKRFHVFLTELSKFDITWFEERESDQRWMQGKHGAKMARELKRLSKPLDASPLNVQRPAASLVKPSTSTKAAAIKQQHPEQVSSQSKPDEAINTGTGSESEPTSKTPDKIDEQLVGLFETVDLNDVESNEADADFTDYSTDSNGLEEKAKSTSISEGEAEEEEDIDEDAMVYRMHRQDYYAQKLNIDIRGTSRHPASESFVEDNLLPLCREYVRTLQWVLHYYFTSVADWKHYYPYHYAPFASDLLVFTKRYAEAFDAATEDWTAFERDTKPLLPFEQQMFIMPAASANILPQPYRWLLAPEGSPVSKFFPAKFDTDLNGKLADWEAVVLIPFIDEAEMLAAMAPCTMHLSPEDAKRNVHRGHLILRASYRGGPALLASVDTGDSASTPTASFDALVTEEVDGEFFRTRVLRDPEQCLRVYCQLPRRVDINFPSLSRIPFTFAIKCAGVVTFSFKSKGESVMLTLQHPRGRNPKTPVVVSSLKEVASAYLGKAILAGWPYSRVVVPIAVMDENEIWELEATDGKCWQPADHTSLRRRKGTPPLWASIEWLANQAQWCVSRLRERCAVSLAAPDQPRASLLCLPLACSSFSVSPNVADPSHVCLRPLCTQHVLSLAKRFTENLTRHGGRPHQASASSLPRRAGYGPNKPSLRYDANVSVRLGESVGMGGREASIELLDLTVDPDNTTFDRTLLDVFPLATPLLVFKDGSHANSTFGRLGEVAGVSEDNQLIVELSPTCPLPRDPSNILGTALEADLLSYMTLADMSRELQLTKHVLQRLVGDFLIRIPPPPPSVTARRRTDPNERRNLANIGLALLPRRDQACVVGWSRYCKEKQTFLFSHRTLNAISKYFKLFPEVVHFIGSFDIKQSYPDMSHIYPHNTFERYTQLRTFLRSDVKGDRIVTDVDAPILDQAGMAIIESIIFFDQKVALESTGPPTTICVPPTDVFSVLPEGGRIVPLAYESWLHGRGGRSATEGEFALLDRVLYVGPRRNLFGQGGFVVGVYPVLGELTIEVMFDRAFEGAVSIRGSSARCLVVDAAQLLHYPYFDGAVSELLVTAVVAASSSSPKTGKRVQSVGEVRKVRGIAATKPQKAPEDDPRGLKPQTPPTHSDAPEWGTQKPATVGDVSAKNKVSPHPTNNSNVELCLPHEWLDAPPAAFASGPMGSLKPQQPSGTHCSINDNRGNKKKAKEQPWKSNNTSAAKGNSGGNVGPRDSRINKNPRPSRSRLLNSQSRSDGRLIQQQQPGAVPKAPPLMKAFVSPPSNHGSPLSSMFNLPNNGTSQVFMDQGGLWETPGQPSQGVTSQLKQPPPQCKPVCQRYLACFTLDRSLAFWDLWQGSFVSVDFVRALCFGDGAHEAAMNANPPPTPPTQRNQHLMSNLPNSTPLSNSRAPFVPIQVRQATHRPRRP